MNYKKLLLSPILILSLCFFFITGCDNISISFEDTSTQTEMDTTQHAADTTTSKHDTQKTQEEDYIVDSVDDTFSDYQVSSNEFSLSPSEAYLDEDGSYTSEEDVTTYIVEYNMLPDNFITKKEAKALGWTGGSLEPYAPGKCIGGDYFGNYEGILPTVKNRTYYECDIDTLGKNKRGAKRIIYSDDGQIYYTEDHYETFELLYGTDK